MWMSGVGLEARLNVSGVYKGIDDRPLTWKRHAVFAT